MRRYDNLAAEAALRTCVYASFHHLLLCPARWRHSTRREYVGVACTAGAGAAALADDAWYQGTRRASHNAFPHFCLDDMLDTKRIDKSNWRHCLAP